MTDDAHLDEGDSSDERLELLLEMMLDGDLTDEQTAELDDLLAAGPQAEELLASTKQMHRDLLRYFRETPSSPEATRNS